MAPVSNRLTYDDDLFLRARRLLGIPVVNQTVWKFDTTLPRERVEWLARALGSGRLGRLVAPTSVPFARDRWVRSPEITPVVVHPSVLDPSEVMSWAADRAASDLHPELGPGWELSYAALSSGGSVLSLAVSHAVGDGGAQIRAVVEAVTDAPKRRLPIDDPAATQTRLRDEMRDGASQIGRAAKGLGRAVRAGKSTSLPEGTQVSSVRPTPATGDPYRPPFVVIDCDAAAWNSAATEHGGSANALLIAVSVEILLAAGRVRSGAPVKVSLPVSARGEDDFRSNATTGVSIVVDADSNRVTDLATVKARSKVAFASLKDPTHVVPARAIEPLVQLLPDSLVKKLAKSSPVPLCLASNLGVLPAEFASPTGVPASSVIMRSVTGGTTRSMLRERGGGISTWWSRVGDTATLVVLGLDPDYFPDEASLSDITSRVLKNWDLDSRPW